MAHHFSQVVAIRFMVFSFFLARFVLNATLENTNKPKGIIKHCLSHEHLEHRLHSSNLISKNIYQCSNTNRIKQYQIFASNGSDDDDAADDHGRCLCVPCTVDIVTNQVVQILW